MPQDELYAYSDDEEDYDPLEVDDSVVDQDEMEDDNPYDTIDYPTMREMPEHQQRAPRYTPESMGSAQSALRALIDRNPSRRAVLLKIIDTCRDGCASSELVRVVDEVQRNNISVYEPLTLARMLERAGALELEEPEPAETEEDVEDGVEYLEITEEVDPVWTSTPEALEVYDEFQEGNEFKDIVLDRDSKYIDVYRAVLELLADHPCKREEIDKVVDGFEVVQKPRRFGEHFIDMLERTDAIWWSNHAWNISDLGRRMLATMNGR